MRTGRMWWLAGVLAVCGALAVPVAFAQEGEAPAPGVEVEEAAPPTEEELAALAMVDEIMREVEAARGLEFKTEFARKLISPEEITALVKEMMDEEYPPEEIQAMSRLYGKVGFFHPELDLVSAFTNLLEAGAGGLYDQETKTLYLVRGFSADGARPVLFHELVHALEDQHFDLGALQEPVKEHSDRATALTAVIEGSAQSHMNRYMKANPALERAMNADAMKKAGEQMKMLMEVPLVIIATVGIYPYTNAPQFVDLITKRGDGEKLAALYANLPVSTEQVLHPRKYGAGGDFPHEVSFDGLADLLPPGWTVDHADTLGELQIGLLLNEFAGGPAPMKMMRIMNLATQSLAFNGATKKASEGWDGDRLEGLFGPDGEIGFVWASVWDSRKDAAEFAETYGRGLDYKRKQMKTEDYHSLVEVRGNRVMVVEGLPESLLPWLMVQAWNRVRFESDARDPNDAPASSK